MKAVYLCYLYSGFIDVDTHSKIHFIKHYVLSFTDWVWPVVLNQLVQWWKRFTPQVVSSLTIFKNFKVFHMVTSPKKEKN